MAPLKAAPGRERHGFFHEGAIVLGYVWRHPSNRGARVRTISRALMFQLRGALGRSSIVPCGTRSRIVVRPNRGVSGLVYANPPEWNEMAVWRRTLKPGDLFIDVGANVGSYSIWAIEAGAEVVAIEPDPSFAAMLRENLALNRYTAHVMEVALSDRPGEASFTADMGVLNHLVLGDGSHDASRIVTTTTLDDVLGGRTAAGVKIDVEGAEDLVLRGAKEALREKRIELLQLEWNPQSGANFGLDRASTASLLDAAGYELLRPDADGVLHPVDSPNEGWDLFARPR